MIPRRTWMGVFAGLLWLAPVRGYEVNTHRAMSVVAARNHPDSTIQQVFIEDLGQAAGLEEQATLGLDATPRSFLDWLGIGAVNEDSYYVARFINHFYNPITKGGLSDIALFRYQLSTTGVNALDWAWDNRGAVLNPDHGWVHAREIYRAALLSPGRNTRQSRLAETFFDLGHVIHLLQDMGQPQHTRNDAHAPTGSPLFGETAPYEEFCSHRYGTPEAVLALGNLLPPPKFTRLPPVDLLDGKAPEFAAFWDTYQLARHADDVTDIYFGTGHPLGLAEISNAFFVTDDTMFTGEGESVTLFNRENARRYEFRFDNRELQPFHRFVFPRLASMAGLTELLGNVDRTGDRAVNVLRLGEPIAEGFPLGFAEQLFSKGQPLALRAMNFGETCAAAYSPNDVSVLNAMVVGLRDDTRRDYAHQLIPTTVSYCTGLLNYFFRGRLGCTWTEDPEAGTAVEIVNRGPDPLREGSIHVLADEGSGETQIRRLLGSFEAKEIYGESLEPGKSALVPLDSSLKGTAVIVVFEGTLGSEVDLGVAVGRVCVPPIASPEAKFRVVDLGGVPGLFENDVGNWGLNNRGAVLGLHGRLSGLPIPMGGGAILWKDANADLQVQTPEVRSIGVPSGEPGVRVMDVNDAGTVVGVAFGADRTNRLAVWMPGPDGNYPPSPTLGSSATGGLIINGAGSVLDPLRGRLWAFGRDAVDLQDAFKAAYDESQTSLISVVDLDDRDRLLAVVGFREAEEDGSVSTVARFAVWTPGRALLDTKVRALAIGVLNNVGQAVLVSLKKRMVNGLELDLPNLVLWREVDGATTDLDTSASGIDLNDCGVICGYTTAGTTTRAWMWDEMHGMRDLASVAALPPGVALTHALRINNQGALLAAGMSQGQRHAYLLVP
jgi:hypothetical protein